jgi:hypothetical protein
MDVAFRNSSLFSGHMSHLTLNAVKAYLFFFSWMMELRAEMMICKRDTTRIPVKPFLVVLRQIVDDSMQHHLNTTATPLKDLVE